MRGNVRTPTGCSALVHATPPLNDFSDGRQRFERALLSLAETLRRRGFAPRLLADDGHGGDRLALVARADLGTVEIKVDREGAERGTVTVLSTTGSGAVELQDAASRATPWLAPVQAACLRTIAELADALSDRFAEIASTFPRPAGRRLRQLFADTEPACGVRGRIERRRRRARPAVGHCHGATVDDDSGPRIALWDPGRSGFDLPPGAAIALRRRAIDLGPAALATTPVVASPWFRDDPANRAPSSPLDVLDAGELACDVASCIDAVDCGSVDVSGLACVPDCGALGGLLDCSAFACVPLDCGC